MSWDLGWQHPSSVAIGHAGEPRAEGTDVPNSEDKDADNSNSPRPAHRFLRQEVGRVCPSGMLRNKECDKGKGKPTPPTAKGGVKGKKPPIAGSDASSSQDNGASQPIPTAGEETFDKGKGKDKGKDKDKSGKGKKVTTGDRDKITAGDRDSPKGDKNQDGDFG